MGHSEYRLPNGHADHSAHDRRHGFKNATWDNCFSFDGFSLEVTHYRRCNGIGRIELMNSTDIVLRSDTIGTGLPNPLRTNR